ncbi:MAG: hypothetical protein K0S55_969, partial [Clostridia bacterium]|nr:hypothetical protein [Clostridia bacterium]
MDALKKIKHKHNPGSYIPKNKPVILNMAEEIKNMNLQDEKSIQQVNEFCSIVDRNETKVVGVRVICPPLSFLNSIDIVKRSILDGTCALLEKMTGNKNPGRYIAVMIEMKTGIDFTYVIGVEVEDNNNLPSYLPPETVAFNVPAGRFGKRSKKEDESENNVISSFSYSDFRNG